MSSIISVQQTITDLRRRKKLIYIYYYYYYYYLFVPPACFGSSVPSLGRNKYET